MTNDITAQRLVELGKNLQNIMQELEQVVPVPNKKNRQPKTDKVAHYLNKIK